MKILVFDNYDSFTYNLVHLVEKILHQKVEVYRNDQFPLEQVKQYDKIILSPGPGIPSEAGLLLPLIKEYAPTKSILGVCLGHQAIGQAFGGKLINLSTVYHGVATPVRIIEMEGPDSKTKTSKQKREVLVGKEESIVAKGKPGTAVMQNIGSKNLFKDLPREFEVGRYHSWIVSEEGFPTDLEITAKDENDYIMALRHKNYDVQGVQFHPESVLTPLGERIMRNWLAE